MTPEQILTKQAMLYCGQNNAICLHINVGGGLLASGQYFNTGVPKGFPDLTIIGDGFVFWCETKIKPRKPTKEQLHFIRILTDLGHVAGVAYDIDEFIVLFNRAKSQRFT